MSVSDRFDTFLQNIALTEAQLETGKSRKESVVEKLNQRYYGTSSKTSNSKFVGSWGKHTRIRPPRDVDFLYQLPKDVYDRYQARSGNKQSQVLQEIRNYLLGYYPDTNVKGDGPIILVPFSSYSVEVVPAFLLTSNDYYICMTDNGGHYKKANYEAEIKSISDSDTKTSKNTRDLIRMMKRWQGWCDVSLRSFWLELVAVDFLSQWANAGKSKTYYDWMIRDFLEYLVGRKGAYVYAPGTYEAMNLGDAWLSKATSALARAKKACDYEGESKEALASEEWQKIFGTDFPK